MLWQCYTALGHSRESMHLIALVVRKQMDIEIPVTVVLGDVVLESCNNGFVSPFDVFISFVVIRCCCQAFQTGKSTYHCEECTYKMRAVFIQQIIKYFEWKNPVIERHICNMSIRLFWFRDRSCQRRVSVRHHYDEHGSRLCPLQWFKDVHFN